MMLPPGVGVLSLDGQSGHKKQATPRAGGRGKAAGGACLSKAGGDALEPGGLLCGWSRPHFLGQKFKTEHTALVLIIFALCEIWQREPAPPTPRALGIYLQDEFCEMNTCVLVGAGKSCWASLFAENLVRKFGARLLPPLAVCVCVCTGSGVSLLGPAPHSSFLPWPHTSLYGRLLDPGPSRQMEPRGLSKS